MRKFDAELKTNQQNRSPTKCLNWHVFELVCETSTLKGYFQPSEAVNIDFPLIWRQTLMMGLLFHVISIFFFTACTLQNSHVEALAHGKIKSGRKFLVKKKMKKKFGPKKKERKSTILPRKEKNFFVTATSTGRALCWRPGFQHRSRRQTEICHP